MPFIGALRNNEPFTVDVTAAASNIEATVVMVTYLNSTGNRIRDIDILTIPLGEAQVAFTRVFSRNTRIYVEIDLPRGGVAQARVTQGTFVHTSDILSDGRLVFDVV